MIVIEGNILDAPFQFIAHQVNCIGVMGAGVAKALARQYPNLLEQYREVIEINQGETLGSCFIYHAPDGKYILNVFGQLSIGRDKRYTDYDAVINGFTDAVEQIRNDFSKEDGHQICIAIPYKLGCGLGGGDWEVMKKLLEIFEREYNVLFIAYALN